MSETPESSASLSLPPEHDDDATGVEEHGLLDFLTPPAQLLVERARPLDVGDTQCDQADALVHRRNLLRFLVPSTTVTVVERSKKRRHAKVVPVMDIELYRDRWITCTERDVVIRGYYFPLGSPKRIPYRDIRSASLVPMGLLTGQGPALGDGIAAVLGASRPQAATEAAGAGP